MSKILVTGGAGFIGSHTCVALLASGHEAIILDDFRNSEKSVIQKIQDISGRTIRFYETDMRDEIAVKRIFREEKFDAVIHFAGLKAVGESVEKPLEYYENNLIGTLVILRAMQEAGVKRIVFSSSATVYGTENASPYEETMPTSATNPYGWTKVMIEQILMDLCTADKAMSAVLLRYFNPIGAHESGLIGEDPSGIPNNLVPYIARVACGELKELSVYGDDYETPDGTGVRDYIHVVDLARAHLAAVDYSGEHTGAEPINVGTGNGSSVLDILHAYEKASGTSIPYRVVGRRAGDIAVCYADTAKAESLLGWRAEKTIEDMCVDSWRFMQKSKEKI